MVDREKAIKECYKYGSEDAVAEWKQYLKTLPVKSRSDMCTEEQIRCIFDDN